MSQSTLKIVVFTPVFSSISLAALALYICMYPAQQRFFTLSRSPRYNGAVVPAQSRLSVVSLISDSNDSITAGMRRIIFEASVSLDGFIAGPDGEMDWLFAEGEGVFNARTFFTNFDTMFLGKNVYERMTIPDHAIAGLNEYDREFFSMFRRMRKFVFSRREKHVQGNGMVVHKNWLQEVSRIRQEVGKNILFCGGGEMLSSFADFDLIDEYVLTVHPVLVRSGTLLFGSMKKPTKLRLIGQRNLKSGVVILHYEPAHRINQNVMTVEVFKTNVKDADHAQMLVAEIQRAFQGYIANFDLDDCDRVLRIASTSGPVAAAAVVALVNACGFHAEILSDEIPVLLQF